MIIVCNYWKYTSQHKCYPWKKRKISLETFSLQAGPFHCISLEDLFRVIHKLEDGEKIEIPRAEVAAEG